MGGCRSALSEQSPVAHSGAGGLGDLMHVGLCVGAVPEGWAPWDGAVLEQCLES